MDDLHRGIIHGETMVNASMINDAGALVPHAYQQMVALIFEESVARQGMEISHLIRDLGMCWVMLAMTIEICSRVEPGEVLSWSTWQSDRLGKVWRRETELRHADLRPAIRAATFVSLLDVTTRRICRNQETLDRLNFPQDAKLVENAVSRTEFNLEDYKERHIRRIYPSWIDELGHTNNQRYGEMGYDALSESKRGPYLKSLKRIELFFLKELKLGHQVSIRSWETEDKASVLGFSTYDLAPSFVIHTHFAKDSAGGEL